MRIPIRLDKESVEIINQYKEYLLDKNLYPGLNLTYGNIISIAVKQTSQSNWDDILKIKFKAKDLSFNKINTTLNIRQDTLDNILNLKNYFSEMMGVNKITLTFIIYLILKGALLKVR